MILAVLLLCAVGVQCVDNQETEDDVCVPTEELACFVAADHVNASGSVNIKVDVGKKLLISLQGLNGHTICYWMKENDPTTSRNGSVSIVLAPLLDADSGNYKLNCAGRSGLNYSQSVSLHVMMRRPTKPLLILHPARNDLEYDILTCQSEGSPKPTLQLVNFPSESGSRKITSNAVAEISANSSDLCDRQVMCCATNPEGQECSQVYDYDLDVGTMTKNEVSNVTLSPGDSLLLRCKVTYEDDAEVIWEKDMKAITSVCSTAITDEICFKEDSYYDSLTYYLMIRSVRLDSSATYTCSCQDKSKSVYVQVSDKDFLSVQLEDSIVLHKRESAFHLQASISYHPILQSCIWESPDGIKTLCLRDKAVTKHRRVWMDEILKTGDYKLHVKAGELNQTKSVSVCVVDDLKFKLNNLFDNITIETSSATPANYSWFSFSTTNQSCETDSVWTEIPGSSGTVSEVHCNKMIKSVLSRDLLMGPCFRFCLTNSVSTWCSVQYISYSAQLSKGESNDEDGSVLVLTVCSFILIMALILISIALTCFVKKKKLRNQMQMIQVVGPIDNDYIYINFKDFEYDLKWEFPRENLELGNELGAGAFGKVLQATAYGIGKAAVHHQVAVKMLKEKHQTVEKEALMSELKMLTHIGHHDNIVNLLGACTTPGPIYLIFQYCRHGDMLNYLKVNSEHYHKSVTSALNEDRVRNLYHNLLSKKRTSEKNETDSYMTMHPAATKGQENLALLAPDDTEDPELFENPDDGTDDEQTTLTYDDLLSFAFQVAQGMEFLCAKNCLHRDLAARNVLVSNGRRVKIGDFGLARVIRDDDNYVVRGNVRLPVKWMAPESIFQGMYTMKSDVWAYGILLWEIFSLGVTPYPGMKVDHDFYSLIEKGFKMERPYYAEEAVYEVMCKCWTLDPCDRPSFSKLVSFMWDQLTEKEEKLYHNLPDQTSSNYQNASTIKGISALTKQNENNAPKTID